MPSTPIPWHLLVAFRTTAGLSQTELAKRAGISKSYVNKLELGHRPPTPKVIGQLTRGLKLERHVLTKPADPVAA